jgi:hypothetical protein
MHRYRLSVDDVLRGRSDVVFMKFYNDSVNDNRKPAACFGVHSLLFAIMFSFFYRLRQLSYTRYDLRDIIHFVCTA